MKYFYILFLGLLFTAANAQSNFLSLGYGLNIGDEKVIKDRSQIIDNNNLVLKLSYARIIHEYIRLKLELNYADYDIFSPYLDPDNPVPDVKSYQRISVSFGPQFKLFEVANFTFLSGFNGGYHYGNMTLKAMSTGRHQNYYFDYAINPLSVSYAIKGFTIDVDSYIGSNMYSNVFVGVGYSF